ncbi:MAG: trypsin-like peptidase domain-containing protein [Patescibacteria group bacterium]
MEMQKNTAVVFILSLVFGLIGGLFSPFVMRFYEQQKKAASGIADERNGDNTPQAETGIIAEDEVVADLVEKNAAGVVSIVVSRDVPKMRNFFDDPFGFRGGNGSGETQRQRVGSGSGFFVSSDGLIVTNKHVVSDLQADYTVIASGGQEYQATVLARDPGNDIAVLKVEGSPRSSSGEAGSGFPALSLGDSDRIKVGQTVIAIGNPLGEFANSVTRGIISGLKRSVSAGSSFGDTERLTDIIQTDAAINPGNSGGPLFGLSGEVIGVNVAMASGAENIGFALPINQVKRIAQQVEETGKITIPYIGVRYVLLDETIQKANSLPYDHGALIVRGQTVTDFAVIPGSPADKAGLMENDIILEINGEKIDADHPLGNAISKYAVGDEITLKVWHKGDVKDVKVKLEERK